MAARSAHQDALTTRALNRALLARQLLLQRSTLNASKAIEHLVGLQAQATAPPYFALRARLKSFALDDLSDMITSREAVRIALMRSTIHLVTARDCLILRPLLQPVQERLLFSGSPYGRRLAAFKLDRIIAHARRLLEDQPASTSEIATLLRKKWPTADATALAFAVRNLLPLVQLPPRGVWGKGGPPLVTTAESWLGKPMRAPTSITNLVLRYLGAFGPARVADFQAWSGLVRMQPVFEEMRDDLTVLRGEHGKELFDAPSAPRPDEDTPAPIRFLGEYDNILLSHADRTRIIPAGHRPHIASKNGQVPGTVLVDGFVNGMWRITKTRISATLRVQPFMELSRKQRDEVAEEGKAVLDFAAPDLERHELQFAHV